MKRTLSLTLMLFCCCVLNAGDEFCGIRNTAFQTGENTTYTIYYTLGVYIAAGEANFNVALEQFNNKSVYHITGTGKTYPFYSFFKVRDKYETFVDTATLQPLKFLRNIDEGGYKKYENVTFDRETNTAVTNNGVFKTTDCIQDVLSAIFYARNINFSKYKVDDKIPFTMFLDNEKYDLYIRYLGKETIKTKYGRFKAIKFKPLLVKGTIFTGCEKMVVWVSDDANHLPLRVESPISVGSIKADMMNYKNLRYPLSSLISVR
ncbi:MAG TPA: DUF3108 domain-containing protein [Chitinophagaceae bacterium]|nr:DUF3108 domain-containing protein [Chitinophagaceae bacterium]